jgi:hypothetical protein
MTDDPARGATKRRGDDYKPVPEDTIEVLERLIAAAEDVIAWYDVWFDDMTGDDLRDAIADLADVVVKAGTHLGDIS